MAANLKERGLLARLGLVTIGTAKSAIAGVRAKYEAASQGRRMRGWNPPTSGPNVAIRGLQKIRDRSRDATRNDWSGESAVQKWTTSLIGIGITPRFKRLGKERRAELWRVFTEWVKVADADGVLNFFGLQALAVRAWLESGEIFVRMRRRGPADALPVLLQVQLIEADQVPMLDTDSLQGLPRGNRIRSGIELDNRGRRVAYWMWREHPGDAPTTTIDPSKLLRIAADEVVHMFEPKRIGQLRGVPAAATILARLRNVENFEDAVLTRQMIANLFAMFIKQSAPAGFDDNVDTLTGQPIQSDDQGPIAGLEPGTAQKLLPGEEVQFSTPPDAGIEYPNYIRTQHLGTAAGQGLPYELFTGDILNISDRALRVIVNEFRRYCEQRQWHVVIPMLCERVIAWWADAARLAGVIESDAEAADVKAAEWQPHGWAYIHPVQDAQGKQIEVDAGFRSRSSVIAERGDDPDAVDEERAADMKRAHDMGLAPVVPQAGKPGSPR